MELRELEKRARRLGVQTAFVDWSGEGRKGNVEALRALVALLEEAEPERECVLEPVIVCWNGKPRVVSLASANARRPTATLVPMRDTGRSTEGDQRLRITDGADSSALVHLPKLPLGYFKLRVETRGAQHEALVISAPMQAFGAPPTRDWGVFVPMYALRSATNWGAGNLTDWQELCETLALQPGRGGRQIAVATLPLMGAFLDEWKCEPSPYSPATRLFWNEFYLDVTRVPEFAASRAAQRLAHSAEFQRAIKNLRRSDIVDYGREMRLKRRVLEQLAAEFFRGRSARRGEFEKFLTQRRELERYAAFRATCERRKESWHSWPERLRCGEIRDGDFIAAARRYHLFAQWLVQEQMDAVLASCREGGVRFYLDLPLGVNPDGYDVWANQNLFVNGASVGAPPDAFFTRGQDWGFPPLHPQRMREDRYRYVIEFLRFQMRHTGLLRLDHVMGLHRLWWVPRGASAAEGAYVTYPAEELYAILCLESHRHGTTLVGENLGTVPPGVNRAMRRHGLREMFVAQYAAQPDATPPLPDPPRRCVASLNTHDMPAWAAFWRGLDIADRRDLGLVSAKEMREQQRSRAKLKQRLEQFLRKRKLLRVRANEQTVLAALLKFFAQSDAELVLVSLEDLLLETAPQNTPGTCVERVNWRRKMRVAIDSAEFANALELLQLLAKRNAPKRRRPAVAK